MDTVAKPTSSSAETQRVDNAIGRVLSVGNSRITVSLEAENVPPNLIRIGALLKVPVDDRDVVGTISALEIEGSGVQRRVLTADLAGELLRRIDRTPSFSRGVTHYPVFGQSVYACDSADQAVVYARPTVSNIRIGTLYHDASRPAFARVDDLLAKHFAVVGTTGSGKSCAVTLILSAILADHPSAHVLLLDPHNEYASAFGSIAEVLNVDTLRLPFWMFDFEEAARILIRGGSQREQESQAMILKDVITRARRAYAEDNVTSAALTVDTPAPFRIHDLIRFLNDGMGRLDKPDTAMPYMRLRTRLESLQEDHRFRFMFSEPYDAPDTLSEVIGRLLRIPVDGKPLTIIDLSGLPSEIADVIVSLSCRVLFDFAAWSDRRRMPPVLLVCEEAHRYVPADPNLGFAAAARAVTRIAKEGRKYGLSLALVSQRPSELSPEGLSQCGTVFALHLGNEPDQRFVARTLPDAARGMLANLSSLPAQQAIVSGAGVPLPLRIEFDDLAPNRRPHSESAAFSQAWQNDETDVEFRDDGVHRWRTHRRTSDDIFI